MDCCAFAQPCLMLTKTIPWSIDRPLGKGRQADHPHVYAHCCGRSMDWRFHLTLGLNRNHPSATSQAHRDVLNSTQHFPAVAISHPAKFGKQDAVVVLFQTAPLRIAKAGVLFLLLEDRLSNKLGPFDSGPVSASSASPSVVPTRHRGFSRTAAELATVPHSASPSLCPASSRLAQHTDPRSWHGPR